MTALIAILTLILAAETTAPARRIGPDAPNAARARAGLLPRKARRASPFRPRLRIVAAPAPTFLAEPVPLAEARPDPRPVPLADAGSEPRPVAAPRPLGTPPAGPSLPEEIGALRLAVRGVSTEVTVTLRYEP